MTNATRSRGRLRTLIVAGTAAALAVVGCSAASGGTAHPHTSSAASASSVELGTLNTSKWVMGYYVMYQMNMMSPSQIPWSDMNHLAVSRVVPKSTGALDTSFDYDPNQAPAIAKKIATAAKAHHVVPMLMVGGAGTYDDFSSAIKKHQSTLVSNLLSEMKKLNFAGLDLDMEPIQQQDEAAFLSFASALRAKSPGIVLSVPVGWTSTTFPDVDAFYGELAKKVDRENIMSYSMADPLWGSDWRVWHSSALHGAGPHYPTAVDVSVKSYRAAGVPASKLGIGIGFYGSCWSGPATAPRQPVTGESITAADNVMTYPTIMKSYYSKSAYHYDTTAQAPYLSFASPHGAQKCTFISYEDTRSVAAKGAYVNSNGLGGEIVWTINQGHDASANGAARDALLAAVANAVH